MLRLSTGLRNFLMNYGSFKQAFYGGALKIYTGSQPADADTAIAGSLLCTVSLASGALTAETRAYGTITLTGGAGGSYTSITVDGVEILGATVAYDTSLTVTAALIAAQINAFRSEPRYEASSSGAVITIKAMPGTGTGPNTFVIATTKTTMTDSIVDVANGVANVNGLPFGAVTAGVISKGSGVWSGVVALTGVAGWFRLYSTETDAGGASTTAIRLDGNVGTSGADLTLSSTSLVAAASITIDSASFTLPANA